MNTAQDIYRTVIALAKIFEILSTGGTARVAGRKNANSIVS
jgi:hypothetical protein